MKIFGRNYTFLTVAVLIFSLLTVANTNAQRRRVVAAGYDDAMQLDSEKRTEIIDSVSAAINRIYVFPDVADEMTAYVKKQNKNKAYENFDSPLHFTERLTEDLRSVCRDRHLGVRFFTDEEIAQMTDVDTARSLERQVTGARHNNYGFKKIERLDGNVGYLEFTGFSGLPGAGETAIAAMNFLAYTDALIIDLRRNGGGSPAMVQLLSSYLFNESVHLNSFYIRQEDTIRQFWTQSFVEGPKLSNIPVFVLTSDYTFSAAEEFTYNLKNLERATIIGETTGGGAHPVESVIFANLNIGMHVPFGRAINPVTGTNWEGTGIEPHIKVPADSALDVAYLEALKTVSEATADEGRKFELEWTIRGLEARLNPVSLTENVLRKYTGQYGPRKIWLEEGRLLYQRENGPIFHMFPMGENLFGMKELSSFRIKFVPEENGDVNELIGLYDIGHQDGNVRNE